MKEAPQFKHNTWWRDLTFHESIRGKRRHWGLLQFFPQCFYVSYIRECSVPSVRELNGL